MLASQVLFYARCDAHADSIFSDSVAPVIILPQLAEFRVTPPTFLGLSQTYQYVFQGALIVAAALIYSAVSRRSAA